MGEGVRLDSSLYPAMERCRFITKTQGTKRNWGWMRDWTSEEKGAGNMSSFVQREMTKVTLPRVSL